MMIEMSATNSCIINVNVLNSQTKQIFKMNQKIIQQYIKSEETVQIRQKLRKNMT